ncbi:unnamed protein product [Tuber aestivum]|uniref:Uncharacterized protein n=1 Tax=Tuber aestivum TaxID=59557 RepID=A0A292PN69_9PEZI|nr:unnamed protein product [Tuber aestivum]
MSSEKPTLRDHRKSSTITGLFSRKRDELTEQSVGKKNADLDVVSPQSLPDEQCNVKPEDPCGIGAEDINASDALTELYEGKKPSDLELVSPQNRLSGPCGAGPEASCEIVSHNMKHDAPHPLGDTIEQEALCNSLAMTISVDKPGGLCIETLLARIDKLEKQSTEDAKALMSQSKIIDSLQWRGICRDGQVTALAASSGPYIYRRNYFLSIFNRDKLGTATDTDLGIIGAGTQSVEGGDAMVDATLYIGPMRRRDFTTFLRLYGFMPEVVRQFVRPETIHILNIHAGVLASQHKMGSETFYRLFAKFVQAFSKAGIKGEEDYYKGKPTDVTHAYWKFLDCINAEVVDTGVGRETRFAE